MERFGEAVSMLGVRVICDKSASLIRRLVWFLLVMGGVAVLIYQLHDRFTHYLSYPTSISNEFSYRDSIKMPMITICNVNEVRASWFTEYFDSPALAIEMRNEFKDYYLNVSSASREYLRDLKHSMGDKLDFSPYYGVEHFFPISELDKVPHRLDAITATSGMILEAYWQGANMRILDRAFQYIPTDLGECIVFNTHQDSDIPSSVYVIDQASVNDGLWINLNAAMEEYVIVGMASSADVTTGFRMSITDQADWPDMENGLLFGPGFAYDITLSLTEYYRLPKPYGECSNAQLLSDVWPELEITSNHAYSKKGCLAACRAFYIYDHCQCLPFNLRNFLRNESNICSEMWQDICSKVYSSYYFYDQQSRATCNERCKDACSTSSYQVSYSSTSINMNKLNPNTMSRFGANSSDVTANWCMIKIYFSTMDVVKIKQVESYTFWSLASDTGGALGLMLGSAIFTVLEIIDFLLTMPCKKKLKTRARDV